MANPYYTPTGYPATGASGSSASMRSELALVEDGFDLLPTLSGNGGKHVTINAGGTALVASGVVSESGSTLTVAGNLSVTGTTSLTSPLPAASGGTGQSSYTAGDLLYATGATALSKLGVGTADQVLTSSGTAPQWSSGLTLTTLTASGTVSFTGGTVTLGSSTGASTLGLGTGATLSGQTKTINIGTAGVSGSTTNINIGSAVSGSTTSIIFNSGGAEAGRFSGGNLGVGTSSPAQLIDAVRSHNAGTSVTVRNANTGASANAQFIANADTTVGRFSVYSSGAGALANLVAIEQSTNNPIVFYLNSTERVRITGSGDVGIGTNAPSQKLDVNGSVQLQATGTLYLNNVDNTNQYYFQNIGGSGANNAVLTLSRTNAGETLRVDASGNLGIGTNNPATRLDLGGGSLTLAGSTAANARINLYRASASDLAAIGTESGGGITFTTGTSAPAERVRIDSSGNLGVGTLGFTARGNLDISTGNLTTAQTRNLHFGYSAADYYGWRISNTNTPTVTAAGTLSFQRGTLSAWVDAVTLDDNGNLLVGTTTANGRLSVTAAASQLYGDFDAPTNGFAYFRYRVNGSVLGYIGQASGIVTAGNTTDFSLRAEQVFSISTGGATERARIDSSGNVFINTTTTSQGGSPKLVVNGGAGQAIEARVTDAGFYPLICGNTATSGDNQFIFFGTEAGGTTARGSISYNRSGGLTAYNTTSDYRAKDILGPVADPGDVIDSLKVYTGKMKGATVERPMLVAHETQAVAPYAVTGEKDAVNEDGTPKFQQMDVSSLVPLLIAEIQTLRARVAALEAQ